MSDDRWQDAAESMFSASVIPARSVRRIRRALADGRSPEPYLKDIERGMTAIHDIYRETDERPPACPHCLGTGRVLPSVGENGQQQHPSEVDE